MKPTLTFETITMRAADLGEESSVPDLFGEQILQNEVEFFLDEDDELFQGYGRCERAYPYRRRCEYTRELSMKTVKTAVLENEFLKAVFLLEYGGRLWELWDKRAGRNLLYTNDVLLFANLAVRNAWFSGGVEWNIGVMGHTPLTTEPLYAAQAATDHGDPVLRMYEYERIRCVTYQMDFWLTRESTALNCRMRIVNESDQVVPMYWWSNMAVPEYTGGRVIVPARAAYTYGGSGVRRVAIPMVDGVDITQYEEIPSSADYFFDILPDSPKYIANVNSHGWGVLHTSTARLKSRKLFSWGHRPSSDRWQEFLTERAGRYLELQAGIGKTQYGCTPMPPHTAWEWIEQYSAIQLPAEVLHWTHTRRADFVTQLLTQGRTPQHLEKLLEDSKQWAKRPAVLYAVGAGYGAMEKAPRYSAHLKFLVQSTSEKHWRFFMETGVLHEPPVRQRPDGFFITKNNLEQVRPLLERNSKNWYACYHLGLGFFDAGRYKKARRAWRRSIELRKNPWALHALAWLDFIENRKDEAARTIEHGLEMLPDDASYWRDGLRILIMAQDFKTVCRFYEKASPELRKIGRLRFYYITALEALGQTKQAFDELERDGGLVVDDVREGEDALSELWERLYHSLTGKTAQAPKRYAFKAYESGCFHGYER